MFRFAKKDSSLFWVLKKIAFWSLLTPIALVLLLFSVFLVYEIPINCSSTLNTMKQAERGDAQSQFQLGYLYQTGMYSTMSLGLTHQDREKAIYWYQRSAGQGNTDACLFLAYLYEQDRTPTSNTLALHWYIVGAKLSDMNAKQELVKIYTTGRLGQHIDQKKIDYWQSQ